MYQSDDDTRVICTGCGLLADDDSVTNGRCADCYGKQQCHVIIWIQGVTIVKAGVFSTPTPRPPLLGGSPVTLLIGPRETCRAFYRETMPSVERSFPIVSDS